LCVLPSPVRPWLVVIGAALLVIGVGSFALLLSLPSTTQTTITTFTGNVDSQGGESLPLWMQNTSQGTLRLAWSASGPLSFSLYHPKDCSQFPDCPTGSAIAAWTAQTSGSWSTSGSLVFPFLLNVSNTGGNAASFRASFSESFVVHAAGIPAVTELFIYTGGAILTVIGALAVFLGIFLRGGVYQGPAPIHPRTASDHDLLYPGDPPTGEDEEL
jgi:hypothetical protein